VCKTLEPLLSRFIPALAVAGIWVLNRNLNNYGFGVKVHVSFRLFVINYSSKKHMEENTSPRIIVKHLSFSKESL
jgi:hypothetical protein